MKDGPERSGMRYSVLTKEWKRGLLLIDDKTYYTNSRLLLCPGGFYPPGYIVRGQ
jgi:hypothetical protein